MGQMKPSLKLYLWAVILAGALATVVALVVEPLTAGRHEIIMSALLGSLYILTYLAPVKLAPKRTAYSYVAVQVVAVLTLSPVQAALLCALGAAVGNIHLRRPWFNTAFNTAQHVLTVLIAGAVYSVLAPVSLASPDRTLVSALALVPVAALLYLVSALAVDGAAAIQRRCSPFANWATVRGPTVMPHVVLVIVGAGAAMTADRAPWVVLLMVVPIIMMRTMLNAAIQFDAETIGIAEEIADAVDARHPYLIEKSRRVADVARQIAQACRLTEEERQRIYLAARLHDVAAAAAPGHAALDADVLDEHQRAYLHNHAEEGAAYVGKVLNLPTVAEIIRFHHERFDGRGYPRAIAAQDIPLESRIIAIADAWVALTTSREYRPALSEQQALSIMQAGAGTKWDPELTNILAEAVRGASRPATASAPAGVAGRAPAFAKVAA